MHRDLEKLIDNAGFTNRFRELTLSEQASWLGGLIVGAWTFAIWRDGEQICGIDTRFKDLGEKVDAAINEILEKMDEELRAARRRS